MWGWIYALTMSVINMAAMMLMLRNKYVSVKLKVMSVITAISVILTYCIRNFNVSDWAVGFMLAVSIAALLIYLVMIGIDQRGRRKDEHEN